MLRGAVCLTQVEAELQELEEEEALEYLQSLGVEEGGLRSLIAATYKQLGLLTYFTTGWGTCSSPCCCILLAEAQHVHTLVCDTAPLTPSLSLTLDFLCHCILRLCL